MPASSASKKKKKGKAAEVSDGERAIKEAESYRKLLDKEFYMPSKYSQAALEKRLSLIDAVIAATMPIQEAAGDGGEEGQQVPASKLEVIMQGLQLVPTQAQLRQIATMVTADARVTGAGITTMLDRSKLRILLASALETRMLIPTVESIRGVESLTSASCVSAIYVADEGSIQKCFDALWEATGSLTTGEQGEPPIRYIDTEDLRAIFAHTAQLTFTNSSFPAEVLDVLLALCSGTQERTLREDTFMLNFLDV